MRGGLLLRTPSVCAFAAATWLACGGKTTAAPGAADSGSPEATSDGGSDGGALTCDEQSSAGRVALNEAIAAAESDLSCSTDSDCTEVSAMTTCYGVDCESAVVNLAGAAQLTAAIAKINSTTCVDYVANGCPPACCSSCPPYLRPYCVAGRCGETPPGADSGAQ